MGKVQRGIFIKVLRLCSSDFRPRDCDQLNQCPYLRKFINEKNFIFMLWMNFWKISTIQNSPSLIPESSCASILSKMFDFWFSSWGACLIGSVETMFSELRTMSSKGTTDSSKTLLREYPGFHNRELTWKINWRIWKFDHEIFKKYLRTLNIFTIFIAFPGNNQDSSMNRCYEKKWSFFCDLKILGENFRSTQYDQFKCHIRLIVRLNMNNN